MLKRKTPLKAKKPMSRKPIKRKLSRKQSTDKRWRSEEYLTFIRSLPCSACGISGCDAHHVIGLHWGLSGQGLTAPDSFAMSLCRTCHDAVHRSPELQQMQPQWLRTTLREGLKQFTGDDAEQLMHALAFIEATELEL